MLFRSLDRDASGSIELKEFGGLLRRLAALARGAPPISAADDGALGAARAEYRLIRVLPLATLTNIPLSYHPFARGLMSRMHAAGFGPEQVGVVLSALFAPNVDEAEEATRQAWLLLAGTDWGAVRIPSIIAVARPLLTPPF